MFPGPDHGGIQYCSGSLALPRGLAVQHHKSQMSCLLLLALIYSKGNRVPDSISNLTETTEQETGRDRI